MEEEGAVEVKDPLICSAQALQVNLQVNKVLGGPGSILGGRDRGLNMTGGGSMANDVMS